MTKRKAVLRPASWSQAQTEQLLKLHAEGHATSVIAGIIGRTKNSVCGQLKRVRDSGVAVPWRSTKWREPVTGFRVVPEGRKRMYSAVKLSKSEIVKAPKGFTVDPVKREIGSKLPPLGESALADRGGCKFIAHDRACNRPADGSWCEDHRHVVFLTRRAA